MERGVFFFSHELKLPQMYFSGLHPFHNGKIAKPLWGMVKLQNPFLIMGEMPKYHQLLKNYREVQGDLSSTRLNAETLCGELDATRDALEASKNLVS